MNETNDRFNIFLGIAIVAFLWVLVIYASVLFFTPNYTVKFPKELVKSISIPDSTRYTIVSDLKTRDLIVSIHGSKPVFGTILTTADVKYDICLVPGVSASEAIVLGMMPFILYRHRPETIIAELRNEMWFAKCVHMVEKTVFQNKGTAVATQTSRILEQLKSGICHYE